MALCICEETTNAEWYMQVFEATCTEEPPCFYQQDNPKAYSTYNTTAWLHSKYTRNYSNFSQRKVAFPITAKLFLICWKDDRYNPELKQIAVPEGEGESAVTALSGPNVQLGLSIILLSSVFGAEALKAGKDAVDGLNKQFFLPPYKHTSKNITHRLIG